MDTLRKAIRLLGLCLRHRRRVFWLTIGAVIGTNILDLTFPKIMQLYVDSVTGRPLSVLGIDISVARPEQLWLVLPVILLVLALTRWLVTVSRTMLEAHLGQGALFDLRSKVFDTIQSLSFAYHDQHHSGTLVSNVVEDVNHASMFFQHGLFVLTEASAYILVATIFVLIVCPPAGLISLTSLLVFFIASWLFLSAAAPAFARTKVLFAEMVGFFTESMEGCLVVRAFGCTARQVARHDSLVRRLQNAAMRETSYGLLYSQALLWTGVLGVPLSLAAAVYAGREGWVELSEGRLLLIFVVQHAIVQRCRMLSRGLHFGMRFQITAERLDRLFASQQVMDSGNLPIPTPDTPMDMGLDGVSFGYGDRPHSLHDINVQIRHGETIGIVGPTGAGKSTLALLISRFYDPDEGIILLGGRDLRSYGVEELRQMFSFVFQETFLFSASVADNIRFGAPAATHAEVVEAAEIAQADPFIRKLPKGYQTVIGERGITLSGGQKQRLSIARAILRRPRFLVLDACTSAVDAVTEKGIQAGLQKLHETSTIIIIAQRYSSIARADRVLVLDEGRLVASGTPEHLQRHSKLFRHILNLDSPAGGSRHV